MKRIIAVLAAVFLIFAAAVPVSASYERSPSVVISSERGSTGYYILFCAKIILHNPDGTDRIDYDWADIGFSFDEAYSDGSEKGDAALEAVKNGEPIPVGVNIELIGDNITIQESLPPSYSGVEGVRFVDGENVFTDEEIMEQIDDRNAFMGLWSWFPYPGGNPEYEDYAIVVDGILYKLALDEEGLPLEIRSSADIDYKDAADYVSGTPQKSGEQNLAYTGASYGKLPDSDSLIVSMTNGWVYWRFDPVGAIAGADVKNPETGAEGGALAVTALAAVVCAIMLRKRGAEKRRNDPKEKI